MAVRRIRAQLVAVYLRGPPDFWKLPIALLECSLYLNLGWGCIEGGILEAYEEWQPRPWPSRPGVPSGIYGLSGRMEMFWVNRPGFISFCVPYSNPFCGGPYDRSSAVWGLCWGTSFLHTPKLWGIGRATTGHRSVCSRYGSRFFSLCFEQPLFARDAQHILVPYFSMYLVWFRTSMV